MEPDEEVNVVRHPARRERDPLVIAQDAADVLIQARL
jgi:hypothetical protein